MAVANIGRGSQRLRVTEANVFRCRESERETERQTQSLSPKNRESESSISPGQVWPCPT